MAGEDFEALAEKIGDPRFLGAVQMLERTGAKQFQIRFCDEDEPIVWSALVCHELTHRETGDKKDHWEATGAMDPLSAVFRLCEALIDGGRCTHCGRPTSFVPDPVSDMPGEQLVCWYQWFPDEKKYKPGCMK